MTHTWQGIVEELSKVPQIRAAINEAVESWGHDIPISVLFSCIGKGLVRDFRTLSQSEIVHIFDNIERAMESGDDSLKAYVATGFLEALNSAASQDLHLLGEIKQHLRDRSRAYLAAWNDWQT